MTDRAQYEPVGGDMADRVAVVGGSRWWWVGYGVLSIVAGLVAIASPGLTVVTLAVLFAVQLFILGLFRIVASFAAAHSSTGTRVIELLAGLLSVIAGVICLRSPVQTVVVLTLVLGTFWLINGIMDVVATVAGRGEDRSIWTILGGLITAGAGILVLAAPVTTALTLAWFLGGLLVVQGGFAVVSGLARPRAALGRHSAAVS